MSKKIYATDGQLSLIRLSVEERENYMRVKRQVSTMPGFYANSETEEMLWKLTIEGKDIDFSIYDKIGEYCGNVVLQNPTSVTPEIGIDLLENQRNKGIAARAIRLLARKKYEEGEIDYYLLRVSSYNTHSKHMIEKMGCELIGCEESMYNSVKRNLEKNMGKSFTNEVSEMIKDFFNEPDEIVYRYKLTPDLFL